MHWSEVVCCLLKGLTVLLSWYFPCFPFRHNRLEHAAVKRSWPCHLSTVCVTQDAGAWQRTAHAEATARCALTQLLADNYGVAVDAAWLESQGVDTSALVATGDATDDGSAGAPSRGASLAQADDPPQRAASEQAGAHGDAAHGELADADGAGADVQARGDEPHHADCGGAQGKSDNRWRGVLAWLGM